MTDNRDSDQEWRRASSQSGHVDLPEAWEHATSNAIPVAMRGVPRRAIDNDGQRLDAPERFDERYVADAKLGVGAARASYRRMMRTFWALRFGVIASGLLVAVLSAAGATVWMVAAFGALAAALEAVIATTNLQNRAVVRGLYADAVARELRTFSLRIDPYAGDDAVKALHGKLEDLRSSASNTQFKLDQTAGSSSNGND